MSMFSEGNIGAVEGTELMQALGLDALDIQKPDTLRKYLDIAKYFSGFTDGAQVARLVAKGTMKMERVDKVLEYIGLRKALDDVRGKKAALPSVDTISGETPEAMELKAEEARLIQEIRLYE